MKEWIVHLNGNLHGGRLGGSECVAAGSDVRNDEDQRRPFRNHVRNHTAKTAE
jgi:hypothetical protein